MEPVTLTTERLVLRPFHVEDEEAYARMNADPRVMEFFPHTLSREESDGFAAHIRTHFEEHGYGLWAAGTELAPFMGFIGLNWARFDAPFTPALEVGFRLATEYWNQGYATEGAKAALDFVFTRTDITEVVSFTAVLNERSQHVIEKVGLRRDPSCDFEHPSLTSDHPLSPHVLFRIHRDDWP